MHYKKVAISYIQTSPGKLPFEQFYLGISERALLLQAHCQFWEVCLSAPTTSYTDFSLCMDFYVVISILGPPEAATSRFLFHMAILSACSYKTDENGKGKSEEETTQTIPCRQKSRSDLVEKLYYPLPLILLG